MVVTWVTAPGAGCVVCLCCGMGGLGVSGMICVCVCYPIMAHVGLVNDFAFAHPGPES